MEGNCDHRAVCEVRGKLCLNSALGVGNNVWCHCCRYGKNHLPLGLWWEVRFVSQQAGLHQLASSGDFFPPFSCPVRGMCIKPFFLTERTIIYVSRCRQECSGAIWIKCQSERVLLQKPMSDLPMVLVCFWGYVTDKDSSAVSVFLVVFRNGSSQLLFSSCML